METHPYNLWNGSQVVNKTQEDAVGYVRTARELHEHNKHLAGGAHAHDKQMILTEIQVCALEAVLLWRSGQVDGAYQLALEAAKAVRQSRPSLT